MNSIHITRRTFGAGLALGFPVALAAGRAFAQTPGETGNALDFIDTVSGTPPADLLARLLATPFTSAYGPQEATFDPVEWQDLAEHQYSGTAVGGVLLRRSDDAGDSSGEMLGGYIIYPDPDASSNGFGQLYEAESSGGVDAMALSFGGVDGYTLVSASDAFATSTVLVGNVLVQLLSSASDADPQHDRAAAVFQSTVNAVAMVEHLMRIVE